MMRVQTPLLFLCRFCSPSQRPVLGAARALPATVPAPGGLGRVLCGRPAQGEARGRLGGRHHLA